jgi:hypothetical protein
VVNVTLPPKLAKHPSLVRFAVRICLWLLLMPYARFTYFVGPQLEQFLRHRGIEVPGGIVLAFRASHIASVYFILFAMLVMIDGAGLLAMALTQVAQSVSRTWSRVMWVPR